MAELEKIEELAEKIAKYQKSYYTGEAEISDAEFDALWDELKQLAPEHPLLQKIGSDIAKDVVSGGNFEKARHRIPMGSQEKAANPEQFLAWAAKHKYDEYLVEYKLDGASLELQYEAGKFLKAVTRGDGEIGDDITKNVLKMKGLVPVLDGAYTGGVRGEVIMSHEVHKTFFSDKTNCRNAANGLMKRKDGEGSEYLEVICYDAFFSDFGNDEQPFTDESGKMKWLAKAGFNTVPVKICVSAEDVIDYRAEVMENRKNLPFDIDGLVIKNNQIDMEDARRNRPDKQIAFKFSLEEAVSILRRVVWNENGATYTPVAEFDTVELAGTKVSRASLVNPDTIKKLGIEIGSHVVVTKRGEIIPKIEYVLSEKKNLLFSETMPIELPETCAACGSKLVNEGTRLYCPNKSCSKRVLHQLEKWIDSADIRDLGTTLIRDLFASGDVKSISDIYKLNEATLTKHFLNEESLEKDKQSLGAKKVLASIEKSRKISLENFIAGFDIEGIGSTMVEKLIAGGFDSLEKLQNATEDGFSAVYGFADITSHTLAEGLKDYADEMNSLVSEGTILIESASKENLRLSGMSFCFTGELHSMKRAEAEALVKANGGTCKSSVTKDLTYLVTNDTSSGSTKNQKASSYGISIIDEESFLKMVK
ncbi:MAG: NAD-dependent DNA ligase LigA [Treponemataceae bacterium]|nr:NAD-dependent DNA ligase LigA [Treponemataceae bacterium]